MREIGAEVACRGKTDNYELERMAWRHYEKLRYGELGSVVKSSATVPWRRPIYLEGQYWLSGCFNLKFFIELPELF